MADTSAIEWTDATVNFWWGCTKVGPGCDHCYAETWNAFRGNKLWGLGAPRRRIEGAPAALRRLHRGHDRFFAQHARRRRVFMQSMSDIFDNEVDQSWRVAALAEAEDATNLDIQLLTKRIPNVGKMVPAHWRAGQWPRHVGLMITVVNQQEADRDIPRLLSLKYDLDIPWVGLSIEPMLGQIDLRFLKQPNGGFGPYWLDALDARQAGWFADETATQLTWDDSVHDQFGTIDWVIAGGESGREARPMQLEWIRSIREQCAETRTPFLFKQWGCWAPLLAANPPTMFKATKSIAGRILDGRTHDDFWRQSA